MMDPTIKSTLIGIGAGLLGQAVIVAVVLGGWRVKLQQHSDLFKLLPCLKPHVCVMKGEIANGN